MTYKPSPASGNDVEATTALDEPLATTLQRWRTESGDLERLGVYDWLTHRVDSDRVLEIGCGFGASTAALVRGGKCVFALDSRMECLEATQHAVPQATLGVADVLHYDERLVADLHAFGPQAVVCWLAGAPASALPRDVPPQYAVMQHRLQLQQAVIQLASRLPTVRTVHLADRTAFPWKMKDAGRKTMAGMITAAVIGEAPFTLSEADVQFKKIELTARAAQQAKSQGGRGIANLVPVIGEATIKRRHNENEPILG